MKRIKILAFGLVLGLAGAVYAAGGSAQSRPHAGDTDRAEANCCAPGASCCTGGSCCTHKR